VCCFPLCVGYGDLRRKQQTTVLSIVDILWVYVLCLSVMQWVIPDFVEDCVSLWQFDLEADSCGNYRLWPLSVHFERPEWSYFSGSKGAIVGLEGVDYKYDDLVDFALTESR
ncbi:hypothetical protein AMTR_s00016p00028570, partial [Amborella trichopoda]